MNGAPEDLLEDLDDQQRLAATTLRGPVVVLAGAGTGKTRTITRRIAYGVATGVYPPRRVMAVTFTAKAAAELRSRLAALGAEGVAARTFHAAALAQLNHFWPLVVGGAAPRVLDSKARLVAQAAEVVRMRLDAAGIRDAAAEIEFRKVSGLGIPEYAARAAMRALPGSPDQFVALLETYERLKDEARVLDFEDVLLATAGMIETEPRVATEVREQYRFFVVDEYQDVSPVQQQLLDAWLGGSGEVCVVGDASQTIYSFAGARSQYLLRFADTHPDAALVRLERNYRSVPGVVEPANRLMAGQPGALRLVSAAVGDERDGACSIRRYANDVEEARGVAGEIGALLHGGTPAESIAVLYRVNGQAAALEAALTDAGVPIVARGAKRYFEQPVVRQAIMLLRAAAAAALEEPLFKSVSDALRELGYTHRPPAGPGEQRSRWELLDALATMSEQAPAGATLPGFVADLAERAAAQHDPPLRAVTLATLHSAKGLEWPIVFLVGLAEGLLPIAYATRAEEVDEERRLLYVGVTRARERLRLSWSAQAPHRSTEREVSRFVADLLPGPGPTHPPASGTRSARARPARTG